MVIEANSSLFWIVVWLAFTFVATALSSFAIPRITLFSDFFIDNCLPLTILSLISMIPTLIALLIGIWFGTPALTGGLILSLLSISWIVLFNAGRHTIGLAAALMHGPK